MTEQAANNFRIGPAPPRPVVRKAIVREFIEWLYNRHDPEFAIAEEPGDILALDDMDWLLDQFIADTYKAQL